MQTGEAADAIRREQPPARVRGGQWCQSPHLTRACIPHLQLRSRASEHPSAATQRLQVDQRHLGRHLAAWDTSLDSRSRAAPPRRHQPTVGERPHLPYLEAVGVRQPVGLAVKVGAALWPENADSWLFRRRGRAAVRLRSRRRHPWLLRNKALKGARPLQPAATALRVRQPDDRAHALRHCQVPRQRTR